MSGGRPDAGTERGEGRPVDGAGTGETHGVCGARAAAVAGGDGRFWLDKVRVLKVRPGLGQEDLVLGGDVGCLRGLARGYPRG
jgi:hypothetical protein